jgi:hypothetical protein
VKLCVQGHTADIAFELCMGKLRLGRRDLVITGPSNMSFIYLYSKCLIQKLFVKIVLVTEMYVGKEE